MLLLGQTLPPAPVGGHVEAGAVPLCTGGGRNQLSDTTPLDVTWRQKAPVSAFARPPIQKEDESAGLNRLQFRTTALQRLTLVLDLDERCALMYWGVVCYK